MDSRVDPARDVQAHTDIGQACYYKKCINAAIKIESRPQRPGCCQDYPLSASHKACRRLVRPIFQIALDHFSTWVISFRLCRDAMTSHTGLIHLPTYELLPTLLFVFLAGLIMPLRFYVQLSPHQQCENRQRGTCRREDTPLLHTL